MKTKIALFIVLTFAVLQLFQGEQVSANIDPSQDFLSLSDAPEELRVLIKETCYDCHSNQPKYPWYAKVAPVSWWIDDHIEEGREHLNFSAWGEYSAKKKAHKLEECYEEIAEEEMPLYSYTIMHSEAQFSEEQKAKLIAFFKSEEAKFQHLQTNSEH